MYSTITRNNSQQHLHSTYKTILCTKLVKTKTAPLTNPFHHAQYNDHLLYKDGQGDFTFIVMLIWNTYTKKCVDDYHAEGMTFYKKIIIKRQNHIDRMHYYKILPQNCLPSSFIISGKTCEVSWCSLCSLTISSTTELKLTEKPFIGGATFLTPIYSLQTPKTILFAALIWFKLRRSGM